MINNVFVGLCYDDDEFVISRSSSYRESSTKRKKKYIRNKNIHTEVKKRSQRTI